MYLIWPIDLISDLFGPVGRIDDLLVIALVAWQAYKYARAPKTTNKELARQYHPDKVAQLGIDLQKLAHEKMIEIQRAYDELLAKATRG